MQIISFSVTLVVDMTRCVVGLLSGQLLRIFFLLCVCIALFDIMVCRLYFTMHLKTFPDAVSN